MRSKLPAELFAPAPPWWRPGRRRYWRAQIVVWATLVQFGPSSGYHVSNHTGYDAGTIYLTLMWLKDRDLVQRIDANGRILWAATS